MYGLILHLAQGTASGFVSAPGEGAIEPTVINLVQWLRLVLETTGAIIVGIGMVVTLYELSRVLCPPRSEGYNRVRLAFARHLGLALEFQLGADILSTAIAPSWDQIGKLAAIAIIRTVLNSFLSREMREERRKTESAETTLEPSSRA